MVLMKARILKQNPSVLSGVSCFQFWIPVCYKPTREWGLRSLSSLSPTTSAAVRSLRESWSEFEEDPNVKKTVGNSFRPQRSNSKPYLISLALLSPSLLAVATPRSRSRSLLRRTHGGFCGSCHQPFLRRAALEQTPRPRRLHSR